MDAIDTNKLKYIKYINWILFYILSSSLLWYDKPIGTAVFTQKDYVLLIGIAISLFMIVSSIFFNCRIKFSSIDVLVFLLFIYSIMRFSVLSFRDDSLVKLLIYIMLYFTLRQYKYDQADAKIYVISQGFFGVIISFFSVFNFINSELSFPSNFSYSFANSGIMANYLVISYILTFNSFFIASFKNQWLKFLFLSLILIQVLAIILSGSRTAWISTNIISIIVFYKHYDLKAIFRKNVIIILLPFIFLVRQLTQFKYFSFLGRLLIYKVSLKAISAAFLIGYGIDSFSSVYNLKQAQYFGVKNLVDNEWFVADSMKNACSDFVQYFFELGFIGIALILAILYVLINKIQRSSNINGDSQSIFLALLGVIICGCFSYPLQELTICLISVFFFTLIVNSLEYDEREVSVSASRVINIVMGGFLVLLFLISCDIIALKKQWSETIKNSPKKGFDKNQYETLYLGLKHNKIFLYNYGCELSKAGRYSESIKVIDEAIKKTVDEKLLCFQAENYYQINRFVDAEQAYFSACNMVPSRFFPKYFLMVFYINTRSNQKAIDIGKKILEMPEKKRDNQSIQIKLSTEFLIDSLTKIK